MTLALALALGTLVAGCKKEGQGERAGREIDRAAEKAGRQVKHVGDNLKQSLKDLKK
jgi:hypothetical protein